MLKLQYVILFDTVMACCVNNGHVYAVQCRVEEAVWYGGGDVLVWRR